MGKKQNILQIKDMEKQKISIFIISPNDVKPERLIVKKVCHKLNESVGNRFEIVPVVWEDYPLTYVKNPQESIDALLENADIYVVILWHRLGTVVEGCQGAVTGENNVTGTQYEIEKILALGKERIFFYFKRETPTFTPKELEEALKQQKLLEHFITTMELRKNSTRHGYHDFVSTDAFEKQITKHLTVEIERMTGINITPHKQKNSKNSKNYPIWFLLVLMILFVAFYMFSFQPPVTASEVVQLHQTKREKQTQRSGIYVSLKDGKEIYLPLWQRVKEESNRFVNSKERAAYEIVFSLKSKEKHYMIANEPMTKSLCTISYKLIDLPQKIIKEVYQSDAEAIDFDTQQAKKQCFQNAYQDIVNKLSRVLKGVQ